MRALLGVGLIVILAACGRRAGSPPQYDQLTSQIIQQLKTPDDPYRIIYHPAVDLAKKAGP